MFGILEDLGCLFEDIGLAIGDVIMQADAKAYQAIHASEPVKLEGKTAEFFEKLVDSCEFNTSTSESRLYDLKVSNLLNNVISIMEESDQKKQIENVMELSKTDFDFLDEDKFLEWLKNLITESETDKLKRFECTIKLNGVEKNFAFKMKESYSYIGDKIVKICSLLDDSNKNIKFLKMLFYGILSEHDITKGFNFGDIFEETKSSSDSDENTAKAQTAKQDDSNKPKNESGKTFGEASGLVDVVTRNLSAMGVDAQ